MLSSFDYVSCGLSFLLSPEDFTDLALIDFIDLNYLMGFSSFWAISSNLSFSSGWLPWFYYSTWFYSFFLLRQISKRSRQQHKSAANKGSNIISSSLLLGSYGREGGSAEKEQNPWVILPEIQERQVIAKVLVMLQVLQFCPAIEHDRQDPFENTLVLEQEVHDEFVPALHCRQLVLQGRASMFEPSS